MTLKKTTFVPKNRRGLSSVVGALFFTVLMIAGFSVLSLALDAQTDIVTTQRIVFDIEIKKQQEQFGIIASTDGNDLLTVSVNNLHVSQYFCPCEYLFPTSGFLLRVCSTVRHILCQSCGMMAQSRYFNQVI